MLPRRCTMIEVIIRECWPWPVNYDVTCQTIHSSADFFYNETLYNEKLGTYTCSEIYALYTRALPRGSLQPSL